MGLPIFIYDPLASDKLSKVRGIGRYMQLLKENLPGSTFTSDLSSLPIDAALINPFFNLTQPPVITKRITHRQIAVIHDLIPLKYPSHFPLGLRGSYYVWRNKRTLSHYDTVVTVSQVSKRDITSILDIDEKKVQIIYHALPRIFDTSSLSTTLPPGLKTHEYFIYVGDATWNKNLINTAKAIKQAGVTCVFVGGVFKRQVDLDHPWNREYKEFMTFTKGDPHFVFPGFIADDDLLGLYKGAIANILLSRDEGFGFSYLEAASQNTPSLLSDIPIFHEIARGGAYFVDPENPTEIANQLKNLSTAEKIDTNITQQMKQNLSTYSASKFARDWQSVLS